MFFGYRAPKYSPAPTPDITFPWPDPTNEEIVALTAENLELRLQLAAATAPAAPETPETEDEKRAARTRLEAEILMQLTARLYGTGSVHLDTDNIDLSGEHDHATMTRLSRLVARIVADRTTHLSQELRYLRAAITAEEVPAASA